MVLSAAITVGYTITLPFAFTQRLSLANWQFLTGRLLASWRMRRTRGQSR